MEEKIENIQEHKEVQIQKPKSSKLKKFVIWAGVLSILILVGFVYFKYYFVYSSGTRVGIVYKFSKKGTIFKTYEGEMVLPGITNKNNANFTSNKFYFSVVDEKVAQKISDNQGSELELHYVNYNNSLPWRGENYIESEGQYVVDKIVKIKNKNTNGYGL